MNFHPFNKSYASYREPDPGFESNHYLPAILKFDNQQPIYYPPASEIGR